jgi:putative glutamine amidotransferase
MAKPLIGISGRRWSAAALGSVVPQAMQSLSFDLHFADYGKSVAMAGGLPVELTRNADPVEMVSHLDGLVLSGGADINPQRYGAEPDPNLGKTEDDRDEWELALLAAARAKDIPVLGICRGFQLINVAFGGTLNQHVELDDGAGHPQWDVDGHETTHHVSIAPNTTLFDLLGAELAVNSLHHQTLQRVGDGLVVTAHASDGVVEGIETPNGKILAVQWHPELLPAPDPTFNWLVRAAIAK